MASLIMATKLTANFSNRVARRRRSFSHPISRSTTLRPLYRSLSNRRRRWSFFVGITMPMPRDRSHLRIRLLLYALSPATRAGRRAGGASGRRTAAPPRRRASRLRHRHRVHHRLEHHRLVPLPWRHYPPQRQAPGVADDMDLGAEAALRPPQGVVGRLSGGDDARGGLGPRGRAAGADNGAIDAEHLPIEAAARLGLGLEPGQHLVPGAVLTPAVEA